jgi:hypothetical protein
MYLYFVIFYCFNINWTIHVTVAKADPNAANAAAWAAYYQQQQFYQQPGSGAPSAQSGNPGQPEGNSGILLISPCIVLRGSRGLLV